MTELAIIGGSGLTQLDDLEIIDQQTFDTPYGQPSSDLITGLFAGQNIIFLARHGNPHTIAPHNINYQANIWALKQLGIKKVIAVTAVGGISKNMPPRRIVIPDQLIDYSYGRKHTFFAEPEKTVTHIDFTYPYSENLRQSLITAAATIGLAITDDGVYGCTQGPRLETAAEIQRMQRDGCDLVGMTGMPEAALARELEIDYATCSVVANWAAGKMDGEISMTQIFEHLEIGMSDIKNLLRQYFTNVGNTVC